MLQLQEAIKFIIERFIVNNTAFGESTSAGAKSVPVESARRYETGDEVIIFQECDYLYDGRGQDLIDAARHFEFVSPYDHLDKYPHTDSEHITYNDTLWTNVSSTTMTFACSETNFYRHYPDLIRYGYLDQQMWENLPAMLWTPIPSIATHMVKEYMAPVINWKSVWNKFL